MSDHLSLGTPTVGGSVYMRVVRIIETADLPFKAVFSLAGYLSFPCGVWDHTSTDHSPGANPFGHHNDVADTC